MKSDLHNQKREVIVLPYDPQWGELFETEAKQLQRIMGKEIIEIHHIGSTAIPGISAKPIIDLLPVVRDISRVDNYNWSMQELGYIAKGENGIPGRRFFIKGNEILRSHHIHIFQEGSPHVKRHLDFRDYLIKHPKDALRYSQLKENLARQYPYDIDAYINGKDDLIKEIERLIDQQSG